MTLKLLLWAPQLQSLSFNHLREVATILKYFKCTEILVIHHRQGKMIVLPFSLPAILTKCNKILKLQLLLKAITFPIPKLSNNLLRHQYDYGSKQTLIKYLTTYQCYAKNKGNTPPKNIVFSSLRLEQWFSG